jgi:hypothetical protein
MVYDARAELEAGCRFLPLSVHQNPINVAEQNTVQQKRAANMLGPVKLAVAATCVVAVLGGEVALRGERRVLSQGQGDISFLNDFGPKLTLNTNKGVNGQGWHGYQMSVNPPPVIFDGAVMTYSADCYWGAGSNGNNDDDQADIYYSDPAGNEYRINAKAASCGLCYAPGFDATIATPAAFRWINFNLYVNGVFNMSLGHSHYYDCASLGGFGSIGAVPLSQR